MTEDQIERRVEKMTDHLDRAYLAGQFTEKEYRLALRDLAEWAEHRRKERA
jgi:hypothetical protein